MFEAMPVVSVEYGDSKEFEGTEVGVDIERPCEGLACLSVEKTKRQTADNISEKTQSGNRRCIPIKKLDSL